MIIGAFIGISVAVSFVSLALPDCGGTETCTDWAPYATAGGVLVGGFLFGMIFVKIVGSASTFMITGAGVALIVALVNGEWVRAPGFVLLILASWLVGYGQKARLDAQYGYYPAP